MTPEELAAIRERAADAKRNREIFGKESRSRRIVNEASALDVPALLTEVDRWKHEHLLVAKMANENARLADDALAEVERLSDMRDRLEASRDIARADRGCYKARLDKVWALHSREPARYYGTDLNPHRKYDCAGCGEGRAWPCPTIRALDGSDQ